MIPFALFFLFVISFLTIYQILTLHTILEPAALRPAPNQTAFRREI